MYNTILFMYLYGCTQLNLSYKILVKSDISSNVKQEIISLLLNMDMTFGRSKTANSLQSVFAMYGPFDEYTDPMFPVIICFMTLLI